MEREIRVLVFGSDQFPVEGDLCSKITECIVSVCGVQAEVMVNLVEHKAWPTPYPVGTITHPVVLILHSADFTNEEIKLVENGITGLLSGLTLMGPWENAESFATQSYRLASCESAKITRR